MLDVQIGCGQITWRGVDEDQILSEIAEAGYAGAPAGPRQGETTADVLAQFVRHDLKPAPGYLGADFWKAEDEEQILARARAFAEFAQEAGCTELYVSGGGFINYETTRGLNRRQTSGHVRPEDGMADAEYAQFARALNQVGEITLAKGVRTCYHNHVGSVIETRAEIDRLFDMLDRDLVFMGPDTGHLLWGGVDVVEFCRDYAASIKTLHIKDIDAAVLAKGVANEWTYGQFTEAGIFTELGQGAVDFPAVFDILEQAAFSGWLIVETDVTQLPTALESAVVSRRYLAGLGY